jgi:hypothetical protein
MQEKPPFYNGSAIQRRALQFTGGESMGKGRRYVVYILYASLISLPTRSNLSRQWMSVIIILLFVCSLTWCQRGEHVIDNELVFSNHTGYVFHDSRGIESGGIEELENLKEFIRRKCGEKKLRDKLHAIWFVLLFSCLLATTNGHGFRYCVPMDGHRPGLDLKFYDNICPDRNGVSLGTFMRVF